MKSKLRWKIQEETRRMMKILIEKDGKIRGSSKTLLSLLRSENEGEEGLTMTMAEVVDERETFYFAGKEAVADLVVLGSFPPSNSSKMAEQSSNEVFKFDRKTSSLMPTI